MNSLFAQYKKEREGIETIENPLAFIMYRLIGDDTIYIVDIYVAPGARRGGAASHLADQVVEIGRSQGRRTLLGSVDPLSVGATTSMKALLAYGMEVFKIEGRLILYRKDI